MVSWAETATRRFAAPIASHLISELHFMYSIVSGQGETSAQVLQGEILFLFEVLDECLVNISLELHTFSRDLLLDVTAVFEEASSARFLLIISEGLVSDSVNFNSSSAHLSGCSDSVNLINASERNSIDLAWSSDEEQSRLELLEENYSLAAESSRGENQNATFLNSCSKFWSGGSLSAARSLLVFGRVPVGFLFFDH